MDNPTHRPDGIFVIGAAHSGVDALGGALQSLSAGMVSKRIAIPGLQALTEMNDQLLSEVGASSQTPPEIPPSEIARQLNPWADEAREAFREVLGTPRTAERDLPPWIWADSRLSFLAPFWIDVLGVSPIALLVHRTPDDVTASSFGVTTAVFNAEIDRWSRYNRSALAIAALVPSAVFDFGELNDLPESAFRKISKFLAEQRIELDDGQGFRSLPPGWIVSEPAVARGHRTVPSHIAVLNDVLKAYEEVPPADAAPGLSAEAGILDALGEFYDADYYTDRYGPTPFAPGGHWSEFFNKVAERICIELVPGTVLDVGCGMGLLVEALRDRGVDARGIDVSAWAIEHVPEAIRAFCSTGSILSELTGHYDLVTCVEVLHELPRDLARRAVENLCQHAETVLFSSTPTDFATPMHLNVETAAYWSGLFADQGFFRDFECDVSYVAPQAVLFRRRPIALHDLVGGYERTLSSARSASQEQSVEAARRHDELQQRIVELEGRLVLQSETAQRDIAELQARRSAEAVASADAWLETEKNQLRLARRLRQVEEERDHAQAHIDGILNTRFYRLTWQLRKFYFLSRTAKKAPELVVPPEGAVEVEVLEDPSYASWVATYDVLDDAARARLRAQITDLADPPLISILLPVYDTPRQFLTEAIESVQAQIYPHWELCIVDDHSTDESIAEYLEEVCQSDTRIKFERRSENGHISAASNSALALATGSWVACLDHDDTLAEHALACFALEIVQHPELGFIYSDEDKISASGERQDPFFKPKFDPLLLLGQNYLCHLSMFRRDLINQVGGYREGYEGSQDWDLALRVTEFIGPDAVAHIPRILYHWRIHPASTAHSLGAKAYAANTGEMAVRDHLERIGASGQVIPMAFIGWNRVKWTLPDPAPLVSIVIPTRDGKYLSRCIDSIRHRTTYPNYEVLVVDNGSLTRDVLEYLRSHDSWVKVIRDDNPFNYPAINNRAVARSDGEVICLLNDDTEVQGGDWLEEMVGQLSQPGVGAVGAKLYYSNGLVQHAGVILGIGGVAGHIFKLSDRLSFADHGRMQLPRTYSVVTAACMVVRREAWDQVGGMDEVNLPVAFNDVDFCLRLGEAGWRVVWTPFAELTHHESISRGPDTEGESAIRFSNEIRYMKQHWNSALLDDPAYNQNLTLVDQNLSPSWPPRVPRI